MAKFARELGKMSRTYLRSATKILTGHAVLNLHLSKHKNTVQPIFPLCEAEEETVSHNLRQ